MRSGFTQDLDRRLAVQAITDLPPLPMTAGELLAFARDEKASLRAVAEVVERDPGLAAKLLGLANSAFFGVSKPARSIPDAIRVLGFDTVNALALSMCLSGSFDTRRCPPFRLDAYWATSMLCAYLSVACGRALPEPLRAGDAHLHLCGLLHSLGLLALVHAHPGEMESVFLSLADGEGDPDLVARRTREVLGTDHRHAGGWLARRWHLPEELVAVLECHGERGYRGPHWVLAQLVGLCSRWAQAQTDGRPEPPVDGEALAELGLDGDDWERAVDDCRSHGDEVRQLALRLAAA